MAREHHRHYERFLWIDAQIRKNRYPNATTIAHHFEITSKTAQRDIEYMRDRFGAPLDYSAEKRGYHYTEPTFMLPAELLTEGEIVTILMASRLANEFAGSTYGPQFEKALKKVASALTDTVSVELSELGAALSFEAQPTTDVDAALYKAIVQATREKRAVKITYFTATTGETSERRLDPLQVRNSQGDWYVIAFDHKRNEVRVFALGRIRAYEVLDIKFEPPKKFDLKKFMASSFQMFVGGTPIEVVLEFDKYQARWIRERRVPHESATIEELPDEGVRLSLTVHSLEAVRRYVLQNGAHVRVVSPPELQAEIRAEAERMVGLYKK